MAYFALFTTLVHGAIDMKFKVWWYQNNFLKYIQNNSVLFGSSLGAHRMCQPLIIKHSKEMPTKCYVILVENILQHLWIFFIQNSILTFHGPFLIHIIYTHIYNKISQWLTILRNNRSLICCTWVFFSMKWCFQEHNVLFRGHVCRTGFELHVITKVIVIHRFRMKQMKWYIWYFLRSLCD